MKLPLSECEYILCFWQERRNYPTDAFYFVDQQKPHSPSWCSWICTKQIEIWSKKLEKNKQKDFTIYPSTSWIVPATVVLFHKSITVFLLSKMNGIHAKLLYTLWYSNFESRGSILLNLRWNTVGFGWCYVLFTSVRIPNVNSADLFRCNFTRMLPFADTIVKTFDTFELTFAFAHVLYIITELQVRHVYFHLNE